MSISHSFLPPLSHTPVLCPVPSAPELLLWPDKFLIHWSWDWVVLTEILSMCQLLLLQTQNRLYYSHLYECVCVCVFQKCEWKSDRTTLLKHLTVKRTGQPETELFYRVLQNFSLHYILCFLLLKLKRPKTFACLTQHAF